MGGLTKEYLLKRVGMFVLTVWLGTTLIFIIPRLAPGDPITAMVSRMTAQAGRVENSDQIIEAWRARFGLDAPMHIQYLRYLRNVFTFNLGYSLAFFPTQVEDMIGRSLPWTLGLLGLATLISFVVGNAIGALLAWRGTPGLARALLPVTLTFTAIPPFMLGILLLYLLAFGMEWLPFAGAYGRGLQPGLNLEFILSVIKHGTLPALAIVVTTMGFWALGMRGMMITTDGEDYMILAQAKGLRPGRIFWLYGVRNSILPQVTALALTLGSIAGGTVIVEYIFTYPGMGYLLYQGIINTDYSLIQGIVFMLIVGVSIAVLILDLLYPLIDPRITYQAR
ncbi:MAG: ABC transporter permease [Chloroflexi bacterium]|nr:ABC transporter permease [Chloroflexota bacterium]MCI0578969.1 ABC transporter permease [Chloroflexota bacterium]MCI0645093.1 ABC transporter permease [Chloroflexota bacterium]MCI0731928.1 ABC transporter permease [Chloroflexota bacterium]